MERVYPREEVCLLLGQALPNLQLATVQFNQNYLENHSTEYFMKGLSSNYTITDIDYSYNKMYSNVGVVGEMLSLNNTLRILDISWNEITEGKELGKGISHNKSLIILNLSANKISANGISGIADGLTKNSTLRVLNLSKNQIHCDGAQILASSLKN